MTLFNLSHKDMEPKAQRPYHMGEGVTYDMTKRGQSAEVGYALAPSGNLTADVGSDGDPVLGLLLLVEAPDSVSTKGTVRVSGVCEFMSTGTIAVGDKIVCSATAGKVRAATTGDELAARGLVTDVSDPDKIVVEL